MSEALCASVGCSSGAVAKGFCKRCYNAQWRANNAGYFAKYRKTHRDERTAYTRQWRADNADRWRAWWDAYYQENKSRYAEHCSNRSAKLRGEAYREQVTRKQLRHLDGDACCYCGIEMTFAVRPKGTWVSNAAEVDHVIPLAAGGEHSYMNTALACATCNRKKAASLGWEVREGHRLHGALREVA